MTTLRSWDNTQAVLERWAPIIANRYQELGGFSNPISFTVGSLEITFDLPAYWAYVEYGRGPGKFPPPPAIESWISRKNIIPQARNGITPTNNQLAYLIGRKIAKEGTQGKHALDLTIEEIENSFVSELYLAIREDIINQIA